MKQHIHPIYRSVRDSGFMLRQKVKRMLPLSPIGQSIFIVGAQKAGTTALHTYLSQHQRIVEGDSKELTFFHKDTVYAKGFQYYRSRFPILVPADCWVLDSTPENLYLARAAERIKEYSHNANIIAVLREPVSRAFSAYNMYKQAVGSKQFDEYLKTSNEASREFFAPIARGEVDLSLDYFLNHELSVMHAADQAEEPALIRRGIYAPQIKRYVDLFGRDNVLILFSDELQRDTAATVNRVLDFLGLDRLDGFDTRPKHVREYSVDQSGKERIREVAGELFAKDKQDLKDMFDLDVPW